MYEVITRLKRIKEVCEGRDYESAHKKEDAFYRDFITFVSKQKDVDAKELSILAREILKSQELVFPRHCI